MTLSVTWIGSSNKAVGRAGHRPEVIVIHIMEGTLAGTDSWFNAPESKVSAHYGVAKDGRVHQYVHEGDTAFHAGRVFGSSWPLLKTGVNPNLYTIGIEHEGKEDSEWPDALYEASAELVAAIGSRWGIPLDRAHVIGHREIYAKKSCPGRVVDLDHLVDLAGAVVLSGLTANFVPEVGATTARTALNIRLGAPTSAADRMRTVAAGAPLPFVGWTSSGQSVHGNPHWYRDADDNYFWAGATDRPIPGVGP